MRATVVLAGAICFRTALGQIWPTQSFKSQTFQVPVIEYNKTATTDPGYVFLAVIGNDNVPSAPLIMTDENELIWQGGTTGPKEFYDFHVQTLDNKPVLTTWAGYQGEHDSFGHGYGFVEIFDNTYTLAYNICIGADQVNIVTPNPSTFPGRFQNPCYLDSHENFITSRNTMLSSVFNITRADLSQFGGPKNGWIFDPIFFEIDIATSKILFQWSAYEHVPLSKSHYFRQKNNKPPLQFNGNSYGSSQREPWDFFHLNSVSEVPGGYLVNSRMTWSMYYVSSTTGNIIWTLEGSNGGSFTIQDSTFFSWEHMPRLESQNGNTWEISLFNNDNIGGLVSGTNASCGYLLSVDMNAMTVKSLRKLVDKANPVFADAEGSYQALNNNHVFLGYGQEPIFKEFDGTNKVIYEGKFANGKHDTGDENGGGGHCYRTFKSAWTASPPWPPKIYSGSNSKQLYMSWNGATNVTSWNIYIGPTRTNLRLLGSTPKKGFETTYTFSGNPIFIAAEAMNGNTPLMNSTVIKVGSGLSPGGENNPQSGA